MNVIEIATPGRIDVALPINIHCARMIHNVPTYAYRFEQEGTSVVFSGDTAPTDELVTLAVGANMLIHDSALTRIEG